MPRQAEGSPKDGLREPKAPQRETKRAKGIPKGDEGSPRAPNKGTQREARWSLGIPQGCICQSEEPRKPQRAATGHPGPWRVWTSCLVVRLVAPLPRANEANGGHRSKSWVQILCAGIVQTTDLLAEREEGRQEGRAGKGAISTNSRSTAKRPTSIIALSYCNHCSGLAEG